MWWQMPQASHGTGAARDGRAGAVLVALTGIGPQLSWSALGLFLGNLQHAEVAEMADALASGVSERELMGVQIPPSALDPQNMAAPETGQPFFFCLKLRYVPG